MTHAGSTRRNEVAIARFLESHGVGDELNGTVDSIVSFCAFIALADGVHGLLHVSEYQAAPADLPGLLT